MESNLIFQQLIHNREYASRVLPYLKDEYFSDPAERKIFELYNTYASEYKDIPTPEILEFELKRAKGIGQADFDRALLYIQELKKPVKTADLQFLLDRTEEHCQHSAIYNAISKSIQILDDDSNIPRSAIPELLKDALSISFNNEIGHDYSGNVEDRWRKLHEQTARLKTGIAWVDDVLGGGYPRKTLSFYLAASGGGKSLFKSHLASHFYSQGYNVLYITLELSEDRIGERIDANLMNIDVKDIHGLDLDTYTNKVAKIAEKTKGKLFIKEYPPTSITTQHIRALLDELQLKKGFKPDVLFVDYINLMNSSRYKASSGSNSYTILKAVAEELRGLASERDLVCITSTQMNRSAMNASDPDMTGVSDSVGTIMTADSLIAIIRSDELDGMGKVMLKCLKTRFSELTNHKSLVGIEWNRMKIKDLGDDSQRGIIQDVASKTQPANKPAFTKEKPKKRFEGITV